MILLKEMLSAGAGIPPFSQNKDKYVSSAWANLLSLGSDSHGYGLSAFRKLDRFVEREQFR
jgi:hypothetical protein